MTWRRSRLTLSRKSQDPGTCMTLHIQNANFAKNQNANRLTYISDRILNSQTNPWRLATSGPQACTEFQPSQLSTKNRTPHAAQTLNGRGDLVSRSGVRPRVQNYVEFLHVRHSCGDRTARIPRQRSAHAAGRERTLHSLPISNCSGPNN